MAFQNIVFPSDQLAKPDFEAYVEAPGVSITPGVDPKIEDANQTAAEGQYVATFAPQNRYHSERVTLYEFYMGVLTRDSFLMLDPRAYFNTVAGQALGAGDGATVAFQLVHAFGNYLHTVNKPVPGTTVIYIDGVAQTSRWAVDMLTGIVTFSADVAQTVTNATSSGANTVLTFAANAHQVGDSVWLQGFTGDWAALNDARYVVTAVTSTTITIAVDSSGYAAYAGNGGGTHTIPQAGETVSADCQHYYQVRFATRMGGPDVVLDQMVAVPGIRLVERRE